MASPIYSNVILSLTNQMDTLTANFVKNGYGALASALAKPLASLIILFIVLTGYGITRGLIKAPLEELTKFSVRVGIIYFFAMNWGNFSFYVANLFINGSGELGAVLMKSTRLTPEAMAGSTVMQGLQSVFTEVIRVGTWTIKKASLRNLGPYYTALMIYASGLAIVTMALLEIVVAKLMLSICLCTAPLFFLFTLFEKTRAFFDRWLGLLVGFSLVLVLVSSVVGLCMSLIHWSVAGYVPNHAATIDSVGWIPVFLVSCLCMITLSQAAQIGKSIGGACHTAGGGAMVAGFAGGAFGMAMKAKKAYENYRQGK